MFTFETPFLDLEIYRLVSILEASPTLTEIEGSESDKEKLEFLRNWEFPEVSRIVISLAAIIRTSLDAHPGGDVEALEREVGTLFSDEGNPHLKEPLRFREACNKVLHAERVVPETAASPNDTTAPLTGCLILYGRRDRKEWRAELDLKKYALSALALTP
jgi:hypothetical protein